MLGFGIFVISEKLGFFVYLWVLKMEGNC
jgi:hypothetical protein